MTRAELVIGVLFALGIAFIVGFLAVAINYPELLPGTATRRTIFPAGFYDLGRSSPKVEQDLRLACVGRG